MQRENYLPNALPPRKTNRSAGQRQRKRGTVSDRENPVKSGQSEWYPVKSFSPAFFRNGPQTKGEVSAAQ